MGGGGYPSHVQMGGTLARDGVPPCPEVGYPPDPLAFTQEDFLVCNWYTGHGVGGLKSTYLGVAFLVPQDSRQIPDEVNEFPSTCVSIENLCHSSET